MKKSILIATFLTMAAISVVAAGASAQSAANRDTSWTGFYAGVHAGLEKRTLSETFEDPNGVVNPAIVHAHGWGAVGGIQLGYNWQFHPHLLAGIEGDFSGAAARRIYSSQQMGFGGPVPNTTYRTSTRLDWLSSIRPKLGVIGWEKWMLYATGGVAWAHIRYDGSESHVPPTFFTDFESRVSMDPILAGWVAGGGVESKVQDHLLVRAEFLDYSIPAASATANLVPNPGAFPKAFHYGWSKESIAVFRVAASYKF